MRDSPLALAGESLAVDPFPERMSSPPDRRCGDRP